MSIKKYLLFLLCSLVGGGTQNAHAISLNTPGPGRVNNWRKTKNEKQQHGEVLKKATMHVSRHPVLGQNLSVSNGFSLSKIVTMLAKVSWFS